MVNVGSDDVLDLRGEIVDSVVAGDRVRWGFVMMREEQDWRIKRGKWVSSFKRERGDFRGRNSGFGENGSRPFVLSERVRP